MPLDTLTPPPAEARAWYRPERAPIPPEPGRLIFNALLNAARHARLASQPRSRATAPTRGDDRIEARAYAVKRWLWRLAHAERSGRFACSIEQLAVGLAPALGWRVPPPGPERARWVRAHRKSIQRWLEDLEVAGVIHVDGERDNRGQWWRTIVELRPAPEPDPQRLQVAQEREKAWKRRARQARRRREHRRRARRGRGRWQPSYEGVRARAVSPRRSTRRRLAFRRAVDVHERRRRAAVETAIAAGVARRGECELLTHPFGAPPTSAPWQSSPARHQKGKSLVKGTGARARAALSSHISPDKLSGKECNEEEGSSVALGVVEFGALIEARVAARQVATAWRRGETAQQAIDRAIEVAGWPVGRACPIGRLREAWAVFAAGPEVVGDSGAAVAGRLTVGLERRAARAVALYEAHAATRPSGWPASGASALTVLAAQRRAASLAGDVQRLLNLAKDMRALELHADAERVQRARRRAQARASGDPAGGAGRLAFRLRRDGRPRFETPEGRRRRVRDELLRAGEHPGLSADVFREAWQASLRHEVGESEWRGDPDLYRLPDGMTERALRYERELADGRWALPAGWPGAAG